VLRSNFSYLQRLNDERGTLKPLPRGWEQEEGGSDQRVVGKRVNEGYLAGQRTANAQVRPSREYTAFLGDDFLPGQSAATPALFPSATEREKKTASASPSMSRGQVGFQIVPFFFRKLGSFQLGSLPS